MNNWYVYIVRCADESLYTGVTIDCDRRVHEHNNDSKLGARYTKTRRPVALVWQESWPDRSSAMRREAAIKRLTRQQKLRLVDCG
ncbi:MAG: GIY-YIG nuclease family protein [Idiomarina sp.]